MKGRYKFGAAPVQDWLRLACWGHPLTPLEERAVHIGAAPDQDWPMGVARTGDERETLSKSESFSRRTQLRGPDRMDD